MYNGNRIIALALAFAAGQALASVTEERTFSERLTDGGRLSIENVNGDITITGATGDTVEITALKRADDQESLDAIEVIITARDNYVRVETRHPDNQGRWFNFGSNDNGSVSYTVSVPAGVNLDAIESVNGDISITGVSGLVNAETVNGGIEAQGLVSNARFDTVNGTILAVFDRLEAGQGVDAETVNGRITLELPADASASVKAETVNGGIDADDFGLKPNKGFVGRDLDGAIGDGAARISLDTVNGAIRLRRR